MSSGADVLKGGQGNDLFLYESLNHLGDIITDFSVASDRIDLSQIPGVADSTILLTQLGNATVVQMVSEGQLQTVATLSNVDADKIDANHFIAPGLAVANPDAITSGSGEDDRLVMTPEDDVVSGGAGNDEFFTRPGDDIVLGGTGDDRAYGGRGDDQLFGEAGNDTLDGRSDDDTLVGGLGHDTLVGWSGNDRLIGVDQRLGRGQGEIDTLIGGSGDADLLILGDINGVFYNDSNPAINGIGDYARIVNLGSHDQIQLAGSASDYALGSGVMLTHPMTGQLSTGTGIFWLGGGTSPSEFIALVEGTNDKAAIQATFTFV